MLVPKASVAEATSEVRFDGEVDKVEVELSGLVSIDVSMIVAEVSILRSAEVVLSEVFAELVAVELESSVPVTETSNPESSRDDNTDTGATYEVAAVGSVLIVLKADDGVIIASARAGTSSTSLLGRRSDEFAGPVTASVALFECLLLPSVSSGFAPVTGALASGFALVAGSLFERSGLAPVPGVRS